MPTIASDRDVVHQIVANLVTNADIHTPDGTATTVAVSSDDEAVTIAVGDDGSGMDDETIVHAFDRFYSADKRRGRAEGGTGLGLAIVATIAEALGGTVTIDSEPGVGTTVTVRLPRRLTPRMARTQAQVAGVREGASTDAANDSSIPGGRGSGRVRRGDRVVGTDLTDRAGTSGGLP